MKFDKFDLDPGQLKDIYKQLVFPRIIEEKMLIALRQGKIGKWFSGIGQEAISVGAALALLEDEFILTLHRNLGVFTCRNVPLEKLLAQFLGKTKGFTKGRDRSFHFGSLEHHIVGMISHLGAQLPVADGIALGNKLREENKIVLAFCGEGGTSEGDFHEAVNVAAVWQLPVIFLIENNGYALSTPVNEQFSFDSFIHKGPAYGIPSRQIDGNNILEVYSEIKAIAEDLRQNPGSFILEARTFRMRGHEEASGTKYVPQSLLDEWETKDPISNYEGYLLQKKVISTQEIDDIKSAMKEEITVAFNNSYDLPEPEFDVKKELSDVYFPVEFPLQKLRKSPVKKELRYVDAIREALLISMKKYPDLVIMGQDIAEYGGAFKVTEGFVEEFGKNRIRNTPLCESAIIGIALGLSMRKMKPVVEMQFADFVSCGFNQIVNNLAKVHYRWGQNADVVIRMPTGGGTGGGPFHSQSTESWFFHVPGLKIVFPSSPEDAKGLLLAAIWDPNPVLYFEHKYLYRTMKSEVPEEDYLIEIGKGRVVREGDDLTIVTYGLAVQWSQEICDRIEKASIEIIDLRSLLPWDKEMVLSSVKKTSRLLIVHEDTLTGGISGEISAFISENAFEYLDAPIHRLGAYDSPVPFSKNLEEGFLPKNRIENKIREILAY